MSETVTVRYFNGHLSKYITTSLQKNSENFEQFLVLVAFKVNSLQLFAFKQI